MSPHAWFWLSFVALFFVVFVIDMYATGHRKGSLNVSTALRWTGLWISIALAYGAAIYFFYPQNPDSPVQTGSVMMFKFISGYLTEYSLSVDNLFVFVMIFSLMGVSERNQPTLLKAGILLSIVLRILFIVLGMGLVQRFHWLMYVFGVVLLWTAYKMAFAGDDDEVDPSHNLLYRAASRILPVDPDHHASTFFSRVDGRLCITTMFLVFLVIGSTDVVFAVDSIPAIIGVIREGASNVLSSGEEDFVAITSNVFAVMGLVSLFFALRGIMDMFRYLKTGVSFILFFVGAKMLLVAVPSVEEFFKHHAWVSLAVIASTLLVAVVASVVIEVEAEEAAKAEEEAEASEEETA
jgi:tellurite resistance protein TerC